jgi:predicted GH43/DUF377 family glycosyl hydrolase
MKIKLLIGLVLLCQLANAQTSWTKYAGNPVLRRDTIIANLPNDLIVISDCWVIKEDTTYKMWYTAGGINYPADTLLRSRICYATSVDGINWTKYSGNPVLDVSYTGGWDSLGVETVSILIDSLAPPTEKYKMWYAGQYFNSYRYDIGYAYSADGINWTKHTNPVLQVGISSEWDNGFLEGPSVIKEAGIYKMWYCGYDAVVDGNGTDGRANLGYATSPDGINWTKYAGNPILTTGTNTWDSIHVQDPHVIKEGGIYYMWYGGGASDTYYDQQVGFATSPDGINWTKSSANPVLTRGSAGSWDAILSSFPSVINDGGIYKMWYTGRDVDPIPASVSLNYYWELGYATAPITSIVYIENNNAIAIFPNPFSTETILQTDNPLHNTTFTIYNIYGQAVKQINNISGQTFNFNRENLISGIYLIELTQDNKTITTTKLIITD